jgi:hypothetical protein
MARSLKIKPEYIKKAKQSLIRNGFARQIDLAEDMGLAASTIGNFLNGKPVEYLNFLEICRKLGLDLQQIANFTVQDEGSLDEIEAQCYQTIVQAGSLLRIKAPVRENKTELINKIVDHAEQNHYKIANFSLLLADRTVLVGIEEFLRWFCRLVSRELRLPSQVDESWESGLGSSYNCNLYFEEYLLPELNAPLLLVLDDVDKLFVSPEIADDFLSLLRAWHERAKGEQIWGNLRLVLGYATEDYQRLDVNRSPFNVGVRVELGNS